MRSYNGEKKIFIVSEKLSANFPNWQKNVIKKWLNYTVKKNNYPPQNTLYEVQKFLHRGRYNHQVWKQIFFSKSLSQIDIFSSPNLEYSTIKNDRPVRSQKIWKIWLFKAYSELYATFVFKMGIEIIWIPKMYKCRNPVKTLPFLMFCFPKNQIICVNPQKNTI